jgi:hypothetical protein
MAFPPNYRQERTNRERAKQRKALEKQQKRDEASGQRKQEQNVQDAGPSETMKETPDGQEKQED